MNRNKIRFLICFTGILTVIIFCLGMTVGRFYIPITTFIKIFFSKIFNIETTWTKNMENVIWTVRFPRLLGAILIGGGLSLAGTTYQGIFKNPLVSPDLLGVSAGACVGASIGIILETSYILIQLFAFVGGILAVILTTIIPKLFKNHSNLILVLSGIIIGGFFSSIQGLLKYIADPETQLATITYWTMGSLAKINMKDICFVAPAIIIAGLLLIFLRWRINILSLGEKEAKSLGINVEQLRGVAIICSTILTASSICLAGTIGWIGLVIPHLGRLLVGSDNRYLIPISTFLGASFLIVVDTLARNINGSEIPISLLTGFIGTTLYTWLLIKQHTKI